MSRKVLQVCSLSRSFSIALSMTLWLCPTVFALPLYTDSSNHTRALVLCSGLELAVSGMRTHEVTEHSIGASWVEQNCVSIDVCTQKSSNDVAVASGEWLHANSSALRLSASLEQQLAAESGVRAHNYGSLEFARVPEGLRVEACAPDFDLWRRMGTIACNEDTIVTIITDSDARACPGELPHTLLDCVRPLQFDASTDTLVWRPPDEKMHFGSATWNEACSTGHDTLGQDLPDMVRAMCVALGEYTLTLPVPAIIGSTSLIRYTFVPGYGCNSVGELETRNDETMILSSAAAPNRIRQCQEVVHGTTRRSDAYTCSIDCDAGFTLRDSQAGGLACVSVCDGLSESCGPGNFAHLACSQGSLELYNCSRCPGRPGYAGREAAEYEDVFACHYTQCAPGTFSAGLEGTVSCEPCPVNTISAETQAVECKACNTTATGMYQGTSGQSTCSTCLWNTSVSAQVCPAGTSFVVDFTRLQDLFILYKADHDAHAMDFLSAICSRGFACLPCEPGFYESERVCLPCPYGSFFAGFGAEACHACALGQNTTSLASKHSGDCVCTPGFE